MSNVIHLNVQSAGAWNPLPQLVEEAYSEQISIFDYQIGRHIPIWRGAKVRDLVIYAIDDIQICSGEITFIRSQAFRPRWINDNRDFNIMVDFTYGMCMPTFDRKWVEFMKSQHRQAIDQKRWLFAATVVVRPTMFFIGNKPLIDEKVQRTIELEEEQARLSSPFYMGGMIDE